ncbi:hypothetical protein ACLKA6_000622 [Drosophila palustris]
MEDRDPFKKNFALTRTPPLASPKVVNEPHANCSVAMSRIASLPDELADSETPKRPRDPDSPSNKSRNTPPKKTKTNCQEVKEMGSILEELIYIFTEKQPITRHVNLATKSMLHRLKELQGTVYTQITDASNQLAEALDRIEFLSQKSPANTTVQIVPDEPTLDARPSCTVATQTSSNLASKEPRMSQNAKQKKKPLGATQEGSAQEAIPKHRKQSEGDKQTSGKSLQTLQPGNRASTITQEQTNNWTETWLSRRHGQMNFYLANC